MSKEKIARTEQGEVVSNKMDKTIVVLVTRREKHPLYGKFVLKSSKFLADDPRNECSIGDIVRIQECRPLSKKKSWALESVIERVQ